VYNVVQSRSEKETKRFCTANVPSQTANSKQQNSKQHTANNKRRTKNSKHEIA
jgi:hypothetical protein